MKYLMALIILTAVGYYLIKDSSSIKIQPEKIEQDSDEKLLEEAANANADNFKLEPMSKYSTLEYYLFDMLEKCSDFLREEVRTDSEFESYISQLSNQTVMNTSPAADVVRLRQKFETCSGFLLEYEGEFDPVNSQALLKEAVNKKDPSAMAKMAFDDLILRKKKIVEIKDNLIFSLKANNPEALRALSLIVAQLSKKEDRRLIGAALLIRACEAGFDDCGPDNPMVKYACEEQQICAGSLPESIMMTVPTESANDFENTLIEIGGIVTDEGWQIFFAQNFPSDETN